MKAEQEKISAKVRAVSMHLNGGKLQLPAEEESCYVVLVAESGCTLQYAEQTMLLNPGGALLLGLPREEVQFEICLPASQDLTLNPSLLTAALEEHLGVPAAAANILRTKFLTAEKTLFA